MLAEETYKGTVSFDNDSLFGLMALAYWGFLATCTHFSYWQFNK